MERYDIQVISHRYIRGAILEEYVNSKIDDFGEKWKYETARGNKIKFTALRELTDDEIEQLYKRSNPHPLFVSSS
ncbi:hypothetical protein EJ04DRAFT_579961 [Polyplosphaeria fusca]|uniref:Uncharacterized protein n=1 Tax=Polyplosphaeria fusca TaxID=682080 RepID=A0A9P4QSY2_9PLEO|nr:hypothetical protein EJ04DRAFT_579961 [Polyplosphaeria fusca]